MTRSQDKLFRDDDPPRLSGPAKMVIGALAMLGVLGLTIVLLASG